MKVVVKIGFSRFTDDALSTEAQRIINMMTDAVADYPTPSPTLALVQAAKDAFATAKADKGGTEKTAFKNKMRAALITDFLKPLGLYVQLNCSNDAAKALRSGYSIRNQGVPIGDLPKPENFKVKNGDNPGEIKASMNSMGRKADSYLFRYTQVLDSDPSTWTVVPASKARTLITGLTSGQQVRVQCAGVGTSTHLVWSDVITIYVS